MGLSDFRLLSRPHRVIFAGFESTTTRLQQSGWKLAAEQMIHDGQIRLALRLGDAGLYMIADQQGYGFFGDHERAEILTFHIRHCSSKMVINLHESIFNFKPIDAMTQMTTAPRKDIEDFGIFATPLVRTEEIIVEPQSVAECLELIKKMQAPELAAIRKRNADEYRQPIQRQTFHAQILSLAA